ncbi:hypothetical protein [Exiguobacterium sp. s138]|uniref:hypothetical protein n=1 Tax=Exiguobacterium sp. s138 TaxID=2751202 RepID=UPI001BE5AD2A|nr:hypothetical protein [Exiguobacterium sp. s138]
MEGMGTRKSRLDKNRGEYNNYDENENNRFNKINENLHLIISLGGFALTMCYYHYALYKIRIAEYWGHPNLLLNENQSVEGIRVFQVLILLMIVGFLVFIILISASKKNNKQFDRVGQKMYWVMILILLGNSFFYLRRSLENFKISRAETEYYLDSNFYGDSQIICMCFIFILLTVIIIYKTKISIDCFKNEKVFYLVPSNLSFTLLIVVIVSTIVILPFQMIKSDIENTNVEGDIQIVTFTNQYIKKNPEVEDEKFYIVSDNKNVFLIRKITKCSKINNPIYCFENEFRDIKSEEVKKISNMRFWKKIDGNKRLKAVWIIKPQTPKL